MAKRRKKLPIYAQLNPGDVKRLRDVQDFIDRAIRANHEENVNATHILAGGLEKFMEFYLWYVGRQVE